MPVGWLIESIADTGPDTTGVPGLPGLPGFVETEPLHTWLRSPRVPANTLPVGAVNCAPKDAKLSHCDLMNN